MQEKFDAKHYWEHRLLEHYDLHGVGLIEWGNSFNRVLYRIRRILFIRLMRKRRISWQQAQVLDIGSGTGFYLERWRELGVKAIHGMDLTEIATAHLQHKFPDMHIHCADIGQAPLSDMQEKFDVISCVDVLFHIIDDAAYRRALVNIASMLKKNGIFIFSDSWLKGDSIRRVHIVHRSRKQAQAMLADAGLEVIEVVPMFILLNEPVDQCPRLLKFWWRGLYQISARSHGLGGLIAACIYPVELFLLSLGLHDGPTTKFIVCRKR